MQMGEVVKLLTSTSGHSLVKSFSGPDVIQQPFSTGKLFNVSEEPVSDLQSLSALLHRLEGDPTHTVIRGSLTEGQNNPVPRNKEIFIATPRQWCMIDIDSLAWDGDVSDQQEMVSYAIQNSTKMNGANRQKYFFAIFSIYVRPTSYLSAVN
jgi:hypothetical protein